MIVSASSVLAYILPGDSTQVVDSEGKDVFMADYARISELAEAGQICGKVRGAKLKYVELIVPLDEIERPRHQIETSASINARTNIGAYRQHLTEKTCWALSMSSV